jgi:lysylphosphatidylglycerol synthetase-like protein (DUF2156 family)
MTIQTGTAPSARTPLGLLAEHGENPSAFLTVNEGVRHFTEAGRDGYVAYVDAGRRSRFQICGPCAAPDQLAALQDAFLAASRRDGRRVLAVQLEQAEAAVLAQRGFVVNQIGASYSVDLAAFTLRGKHFVKLRNKVSRAARAGVEVREVPPTDPAMLALLDEVDSSWLHSKGSHTKELRYLVGERKGALAGDRRCFAALHKGKVVGYITYSPVHGTRSGWMHDLSRRTDDAVPGTMELVNVTAIDAFRTEGVRWLHFGHTPFTGLDPAHELTGHSSVVGWLVRQLAARGEAIYPAATQLAYKEKWAPHVTCADYIAFEGRVRIGAVWSLLRLTRAI